MSEQEIPEWMRRDLEEVGHALPEGARIEDVRYKTHESDGGIYEVLPNTCKVEVTIRWDKPSCGVCRNWESTCICPMENCAGQLLQPGPLKVVASAVSFNDVCYAIKQPARHHNVFAMMKALMPWQPGMDREQGFLLSDGSYATRERALRIARDAGQVDKIIGGVLTSEDLW